MTEILTESFCERCGTRYTFESARPRTRLKRVKVLSRGLKNFVLSDDTSMDEAMAAARSETDREATSHQLDAFHKTFNFCMSCRQYTCPNCWNEAEARCLTCAPLALPEAPADVHDLGAFRAAFLAGEPDPGNGAADHDHDHGAWSASMDIAAEATETPPLEVGDVVTTGASADLEPAATAATEGPIDTAHKAAAQTTGLLRRFRPGQSLDAELEAYEREHIDVPAVGEVESATVAEPEAESAEAATEQPVIEPTPIEIVPEPAEIPSPAPEPQPLAAAASADLVEQPTWRITAPDAIGTTAPATPTDGDSIAALQATTSPAAAPGIEPQWPARPQWPAASPPAGLPFLGRPATPEGGIEALWAASNQELATAVPAQRGRTASGIQPCISCGLSLSANARFCRRCGTLQGR